MNFTASLPLFSLARSRRVSTPDTASKMDLATENQLLRTALASAVTALAAALFALFVLWVSRAFFKSQVRVAELAKASNTLVVSALDEPDAVVDWETLVSRLPLIDEQAVVEMWNEAVQTTPGKLKVNGRERTAYHPVLVHILSIITTRSQGRLRLHRETTIALDGREPDVSWTPDREAFVTGVSVVAIFEVKSVRAAKDAAPQLHGYMYLALSAKQKLLSWWSWLTGWTIALYGAGCTGLNIRFESLVSSRGGIELRTTSYMPFVPWVVYEQGTEARMRAAAAGPTPGFHALVRILLAPPELLGQVRNPRPPAQVMHLEAAEGAQVKVTLGELLGGGSFGNAFSATCPSPAGGKPIDAVVKIYRDVFKGLLGGHKQLRTELRCLRAIRQLDPRCVHLPRLLAASTTALVESPHGTPLPVRICQLGTAPDLDPPQHRALAAPRKSPVDRALAWGVYDGILRGLRALHGAGWLHCDVRLPNCVVLTRAALGAELVDACVTESAVLIDLGCAQQLSAAPGRPEHFKVPSSGHTCWHDLRGALAVFVETALGGRFSLPSALWGKDVLDDDIVGRLDPVMANRVVERRDRILGHIQSARRSAQQAGRFRFAAAVVAAPTAADYEAFGL